jgi:glycine/D-amino acid oxidase-like deaminating enzyme
MRAAEKHGAVLRHATVVDLMRGDSGVARGVALASGETVETDAVVIAMGPWSMLAARWLPLPAVLGYKGHSLVFETGTVPAEALFLEYRGASGEILSPEVYPRANGTTGVGAISTMQAVPLGPAGVAPDEGAHARVAALSRKILPALATAPTGGRPMSELRRIAANRRPGKRERAMAAPSGGPMTAARATAVRLTRSDSSTISISPASKCIVR